MNSKTMNLTYASSLTNLRELNSSFDTAVLQIAYPGDNRNKSRIDKGTFEKCLPSIYNCPIVCNYDRESDALGGHDMTIVQNADGEAKLINLTTPIGVVPESTKPFWRMVTESDGAEHEYLCTDVLIWKRQEAYAKIKRDGVTAQSMEITVKSGKEIDGIYVIDDFEFTAFALIGVEPCFESASLAFSKQEFKQQFSQMMQELKEAVIKVDTSNEVDNIITNEYSMKGGEKVLNDKMELAAKYGIDVDKLDFSIEDFNLEELEEKFKAISSPDVVSPNVGVTSEDFELESNITETIYRAVSELETITFDWGEYPRYFMQDYDSSKNEVYCWDRSDWLMYGFTYEANGNSIVIKQDSKKRVKFAIVDFDEGEQVSPIAEVFEAMSKKIQGNAELEAKYQSASETITAMTSELENLREFKSKSDAAAEKQARCEILDKFADLAENEDFIALREDCMKYDIETLEEKCFAIRGRCGTAVKFSAGQKIPKLKVDKTEPTDEPYGGLFTEYGSQNEN